MLRITLLLAALLCLAPCLPASGEDLYGPENLTYATEEYYPYNYVRDGKVQGFSVEVLRLLWAEMGVPEQHIAVYPWARAYNGALNIPRTVTFSMARTAARKGLFKWVGPISTARFVLFAPAQSALTIDSPADLQGLSVGTLRDDVAEVALMKLQSGASIQPVSDMEQNLSKLLAGRLDLIAYEEQSMRRLLVERGLDADALKPVYLLHETEIAFAFHLTTPQSVVQRFQDALDTIRASASYQAIQDKYFP